MIRAPRVIAPVLAASYFLTALACSCSPLVRRPPVPRPPAKPVVLAAPGESPDVPVSPGARFGWPLAPPGKHIVDSPFGVRTIESLGTAELHEGVDIDADPGTEVVAAKDGRVAWVGERPAFGWTVILEHADRWQTVYGNLAQPIVEVGRQIREGDELARTGSRCDGAKGGCLHFEIRREGRAVDPAPLLGVR